MSGIDSFLSEMTCCISFKGDLEDLKGIIDFEIQKSIPWNNASKFLYGAYFDKRDNNLSRNPFFIASPIIEGWTILCFIEPIHFKNQTQFSFAEEHFLTQKISQALGKVVMHYFDGWCGYAYWTIFQDGQFIYSFEQNDHILEVWGKIGKVERAYLDTYTLFRAPDILAQHIFDFAKVAENPHNKNLDSTICVLNEPLGKYEIKTIEGFCQFVDM